MKKIIYACAIVLGANTFAFAQEAPGFFKDTYPEQALEAALQARGALRGEGAALDAKTRELIALGVSAQIPCAYCTYGHTSAAEAAGATEAEIREAVAIAAEVRQWSTVLNGMQYDLEAFKAEYDELTKKTN
jgi:AhpD family alkylhydroperoxidase